MGRVYTKDVRMFSVLFSLPIIKIPNILLDFLKVLGTMHTMVSKTISKVIVINCSVTDN